jgi:phospholipase C
MAESSSSCQCVRVRVQRRALLISLAVTALGVALAAPTAAAEPSPRDPTVAGRYRHLVVIYEENHSFDNLYGTWGPVNGQRVDGLPTPASRTVQVAQNGEPYGCLLQNDVNLTSPPLTSTCADPAHGVASSHFANAPFRIDDYIPATATTCPAPGTFSRNGVLNGTGLPGGCTPDQVHRFYQEQ